MVDDRYLIWDADAQSKYCVLGYLEGYADDYKLMTGHSVAKQWPTAVKMRMDKDFKKQTALADNLTNPENIIVASRRLCDFFVAKKVPKLELLPITILDQKKKVASKDYAIANPVGTQDCIDTKQCDVTWNTINSRYISTMKRLVFDERKIDKNAVLFRAEHLKDFVFIRSDLAAEVTAAGFTNVKLWRLSDYR